MTSDFHKFPIFVYGTLKQGEPNHFLLTNGGKHRSQFIGKAVTTDNWPLVIATPYHVPFLLDRQGTGKKVYGELYNVDFATLEAMDKLEGHPQFYTRVPISVELLKSSPHNVSDSVSSNNHSIDSEIIECEVYILFDFKEDLLILDHLDNYFDTPLKPYTLSAKRPEGRPTAYSIVKKISA